MSNIQNINQDNLYDVVVIGGGPAGLTAAIYLSRARYRVLVLEKEQYGGQITITHEVVNYPGLGKISGKELTETMRRQAETFGAEFLMAEAESLKMDDIVKTVHTSRGDFQCLGVLLATGAHPRTIGFKGEEEHKGRGVAYCATCDGEFFTGKEVYVVGGGFAAAEESVFLTKFARHVTIPVREGRIVIGYNENGLPKTKNVTAKSKTECIEKLEKLKDETGFIRREKVHSRMTFGEWMDFWYQNYCKMRIKESTQEGYETRIYNHIIPKIGKIPLNELTQNDLQKFYNNLKQDGRLRYRDTLGEGLSDRFVRSCHANCRTALQKATDDRLIKKNPAIGCKIPPKKSREMQVLTPDEIKRFLIQAKYDGFFEIFLVALSTGLRRGEDMALKWEDLNLDTGELKVRRQVKRTKGRLVITEPKTEESVRTIILPKSLVSILKEYKETIDSEWMFPSPRVEGMPRDPSAVYGMMQVILERAECKKLRFHDLRHTFATTSVSNGMDIKTLSTILGHVSSKTTLDIYLHSTEEMKKEAAEKINARFNKDTNGNEGTITDKQEKPPQAKFEPKKGKMRKPGTGCISKINDHLYEGRYSPKDAYGKRMARNIYAPTREECEEKLATLIKEMNAEIAEQKAKLKSAQ